MTAIGLVPHTGWTWLVRVGGTARSPVVEAREKVIACDVLDGELYHQAAERLGDAVNFIDRQRERAKQQAFAAIASHVSNVTAAVVLGKQTVLPGLDKILGAHPLIHGA